MQNVIEALTAQGATDIRSVSHFAAQCDGEEIAIEVSDRGPSERDRYAVEITFADGKKVYSDSQQSIDAAIARSLGRKNM
jgi:hypothetical protein